MLEGVAVFDLYCVIDVLSLPTVQSCLKVLCISANSCEAGKSKGWINATLAVMSCSNCFCRSVFGCSQGKEEG